MSWTEGERFAVVKAKNAFGKLYVFLVLLLLHRLSGGAGGRSETILQILVPDAAQNKLQILKTIDQLPESVFHVEWHNGICDRKCNQKIGYVLLISINSIILISVQNSSQVYALVFNPFGANELKDRHKASKDCSPLSVSLANCSHCFSQNSNVLHVFSTKGQLYSDAAIKIGLRLHSRWSWRRVL